MSFSGEMNYTEQHQGKREATEVSYQIHMNVHWMLSAEFVVCSPCPSLLFLLRLVSLHVFLYNFRRKDMKSPLPVFHSAL